MNKNTMPVLTFKQMLEVKNQIQQEACMAVIKEWNLCKKEGRPMKTVLNLATGVGKTRTAWKLIFTYAKGINTILFMVPKISLVDQTIAEWKALGIEFDYATAYCEGDLKTAEDIQYFMNKPSDVKKIIFAVYNTVGVTSGITSELTNSGVSFDLAIYDECHRTSGKEFGMFTSCVDDMIVRANHKLFMTATIKEYEDTKDENEVVIENNNLFSMANTDIYGRVAYSLTIFEAIRLGILCNFQTYLLEVSDDSIKRMLNKEMEFLGEIVKGRHLATAYSVIKAYNMGARKIVVMYQQRADAHDFNNLFHFMQNQLGVLQGATIGCVASDTTPTQLGAPRSYVDANGETIVIKTKDNRKAQQWWLKYGPFCSSETAIATSSPWLKEGEDVPCIDCIVFGDRFQSGIDIIQIIGRALRYTETKQIAHIILPIMEGEANEAARMIRSTIGNMQSEINEFQIVRAKVSNQNQNDNEQEATEPQERETEERSARWVFENDTTNVTTLEINQGEMTVDVIHDDSFAAESRIQHDRMLEVIGLRMTNTYKQSLIDRRAEKFVNQVIAEVEEYNAGIVSQKTVARRYQSDDYYFEKYASYYNLTKDEAIRQLDSSLNKVRDIRKKMLLGFFNVK